MEKLECDKCGTVYDDEGSINLAKAAKDGWEARCKLDGVEPRGIAPCPDISCPGELILREEQAMDFEAKAKELDPEARKEVKTVIETCIESSEMSEDSHPLHKQYVRAAALACELMVVK